MTLIQNPVQTLIQVTHEWRQRQVSTHCKCTCTVSAKDLVAHMALSTSEDKVISQFNMLLRQVIDSAPQQMVCKIAPMYVCHRSAQILT